MFPNPNKAMSAAVSGGSTAAASPQPVSYRLLWRQEKLWVCQASESMPHVPLPALDQPAWFRACLQRSKAQAVVIDPALGLAMIEYWALACAEVGRPLHLRLPTVRSLPHKQRRLTWGLKCLTERLLGLLLLLLLGPLLLLLGLLVRRDGGPALRDFWCVGQRGKVFRMTQFRTCQFTPEGLPSAQLTPLGQWLQQTRLDRLPRLLNVVRGQMALVGTKPWTLADALRIAPESRFCLQGLPGVIGARPLGLNGPLVDVGAITELDLSYLKGWSLWRDGLTMATAMVRVVMGT